jgi:hypothetical protein
MKGRLMATSHPEHRAWCKEQYQLIVEACDPDAVQVLDVGAGSGTYARELREGEPSYWVAVEIHEPYVDRYKLRDLYDRIVVDDARVALRGLAVEFDLVILGDVVEHMRVVEGHRLVEDACRWADHVLVVLPLGEYPQGAVDGNVHEAHLATYELADALALFPAHGDVIHVVGDVTGAFLWSRELAPIGDES